MWHRRPFKKSFEQRIESIRKKFGTVIADASFGPSRETLEQQIRRASTDKKVRDWLASRELRPPK